MKEVGANTSNGLYLLIGWDSFMNRPNNSSIFPDIVKIAIRQVIRNGRRYRGVIISLALGAAGLVVVLTMGDSIEKKIARNLEALGRATAIKAVWDFDRKTRWHHGHFGPNDVHLIRSLDRVAQVTGFLKKKDLTFVRKQSRVQGDVIGVESNFFSTLRMTLAEGSPISEEDIVLRNNVCVIGSKLNQELFEHNSSPVNRSILVDGKVFRIIGLLGGVEEREYRKCLFAPITVVWNDHFSEPKISEIQIRATHWRDVRNLREEIKSVLEQYHPGFSQAIEVSWYPEKISAISAVESLVKVLLYFGMVLVMILGASGITNLMYMAVQDRTVEIGLRKAMGANDRAILFQFLVEAVIISVAGMCAGMVLAIHTIFLLKLAFEMEPNYEIMALTILGSVFLGICLGIISGMEPARRASHLDPAEAIRFE